MSEAREGVLSKARIAAVSTATIAIKPDEEARYAEWLTANPQQPLVCKKLSLFNAMVNGESAMPKSWLLAKFMQRWILPEHTGVGRYAERLAHEAVENWKKDPRHRGRSFA